MNGARISLLALVALSALPFTAHATSAPEALPSLEPSALAEPDRTIERLGELRRERLIAAGFEKRSLGEGAERLTYFVAGDGAPLLFLHGTGDHAGSWFDLAPAFTKRHRVVALDLPGHGESEPREGALAMSTVVAGAERMLAEISRERPAIVVGNSMGAWIATLLAHRHPGSVARLVLSDGGALPGSPGGPSLLPTTREAAAFLMKSLRDPSSPPTPDWLLDGIVARTATGPTARIVANLPDLFAHLLVGRLGEVKTPVDLLWGASDGLMTVAYAERMKAELPSARLTLVERCGHIPQLECPERYRALLAELLAAPPPAPAPPAALDSAAPETSPE